MPHPVTGVDHALILVGDLDASRDAYARLGFTTSPRGLHSAHMGTANHTIMLEDDYFELLGIVADTELNRPRRELLEGDGEGLRGIACRVDDAAAAAPELTALGITTQDLSDFSRPVELPDGAEGVAAFTTLQFHPDEAPVGMMFMCQHRTRDTVWVPELLSHANGAVGLAGIVATSDDPATTGERYARLFAAGAVTPIDGGVRIGTGERSAPILVLAPEALASAYPALDLTGLPRTAYAALKVRVRDVATAHALLERAGVAAARTADGVAVAPKDASGVILEFVEAA